MTQITDLARQAGFTVGPSALSDEPMVTATATSPPITAQLEKFAALYKESLLAELCAGVEPVAWRTFDGEGGYDFRGYEWNEDYQSRWDANNPKHIGWVDALYPAETVAALKARVAELETALQRLVDNAEVSGRPLADGPA